MSTEIVKQPTPLSLIQQALDAKMDVKDLTGLFDLQERYERNEAVKAYAEAMNLCQLEMPVVVKDAENQDNHSRYARLETVAEAIRPIYTKHGFGLCFSCEDRVVEGALRLCLTVVHRGGHEKTVRGDFPLDGTGMKGSPNKTAIQATGSSISYGKRYLTLMAFNITVANEDRDGQAECRQITQEEEKLLMDSIAELTVLRGKAVDIKALLRFAGPDLKSISEMNVEQYTRVMSDMVLQRRELGKKGNK